MNKVKVEAYTKRNKDGSRSRVRAALRKVAIGSSVIGGLTAAGLLSKKALTKSPKTKMSFWMQSLDNQSPDFIYSGKKTIEGVDDAIRQDFVARVYQKKSKNSKFFQVNTDRVDNAGRKAPLLIGVENIKRGSREKNRKILLNKLAKLQRKQGFTIDPEEIKKIQRGTYFSRLQEELED